MTPLEVTTRTALIDAVKATGSVLRFDGWYGYVDDTRVDVRFREGRRKGSSWSGIEHRIGKVWIFVGERRFPPKKIGHDYAAIAKAILEERDWVRMIDVHRNQVEALRKRCLEKTASIPNTVVEVTSSNIKLIVRFDNEEELDRFLVKVRP